MADRERLKNLLKQALDKLENINRNLTLDEVTKITGTSRQTIYNWMEKGLPSAKTNGKRRFSKSEVEAYMRVRSLFEQGQNRVPLKAIAIDSELHRRLFSLVPGKRITGIIGEVIRSGIRAYESGVELDYSGDRTKTALVELDLAKALRQIARKEKRRIYQISNAIIRCGLNNLAPAASGG
jgi:excisionase family DNA binding protein